MAWFDRNLGGKKSSEAEPVNAAEAIKPTSEAAPVPTSLESKATPPRKVDATPPSSAGLVGSLHKGSRVTGQLSFQGPARIDGTVDGDIQCGGALTIGESAEIRAKISGQVVIIQGKVEGNVSAREKIELLAPARLTGNVSAPRLIIAEGVVFDGDCSMGATAKQAGGVAGSKNVSIDRVGAEPSAKLQAESKT